MGTWLARERRDAMRAVLLIWLASAVVCATTSALIADRLLAPGELGVRLLGAVMAPLILAAPVAMVIAAAVARVFSLEEQTVVPIVAAGSLIGGIAYWILLLRLSERAVAWRTGGAIVLLAICALASAILLPFLAAWAAAF